MEKLIQIYFGFKLLLIVIVIVGFIIGSYLDKKLSSKK